VTAVGAEGPTKGAGPVGGAEVTLPRGGRKTGLRHAGVARFLDVRNSEANVTYFSRHGTLDNSWGGPPGPRGTPPSRSWGHDISLMQNTKQADASAAEQGVRPHSIRGMRWGTKVSGIEL